MKRTINLFLVLVLSVFATACSSDTNNAVAQSTPSQAVLETQSSEDWELPDPNDSRGYFELNYCSWGADVTLTNVEDISGIDPANVFTCVCELLEQKPEQQTTFCADFGILVYDMKWTKWDASGAQGTGIYSTKICEPSCVEGERLDAPVKVFLTDLKTDGKKYYLMKFRYQGKEPFIPNEPISDTWEVGF